VSALFAEGRVRAGGRALRKGDRARPGAVILVDVEDAPDVVPEPGAPLDVRLETPQLLVVEKPAGQPTAPLGRGETGTLANALLGRFPELAGIGYGPREPGLLHRLDNETSGLVLVARTAEAFEHLRGGLAEGCLEKRYLAVVTAASVPPAGAVATPLGPDPHDPRRVSVRAAGHPAGRERRTEWILLETRGRFSLLEVRVARAYRHQIRAHLAAAGLPLSGDLLYGGEPSAQLPEGRHALHASYVAWAGDDVVPGFRVESPLPPDLAALLSG
jgi:23S rRNA pseudouridine1911/1915/1917 synthase